RLAVEARQLGESFDLSHLLCPRCFNIRMTLRGYSSFMSQSSTSTPPVAKFGRSSAAALPSGDASPRCTAARGSKWRMAMRCTPDGPAGVAMGLRLTSYRRRLEWCASPAAAVQRLDYLRKVCHPGRAQPVLSHICERDRHRLPPSGGRYEDCAPLP